MKTSLAFKGFPPTYLAVAALALTCVSTAVAARAPRFLVRDLGTLPGATEMTAHSINHFGNIVGEANSNGVLRPFLYSRGRLTQLPVGETGSAIDISDRGHIIGFAATTNGSYAFLYHDGEVTDLNATTGQPISMLRKVNDRGAIVGNILRSGGPPPYSTFATAFVYRDGQFRLLDSLPGGVYSDAGDINNVGQIAGQSSVRLNDGSIVGHAAIWDSRGIRDLGTLPGTLHSLCTGINDRGQVTGYSDSHGFIYSGGRMRSLGNLPGHFYNTPRDINNLGHIVGESSDAHFGERSGFLYADGVIHDLNDLLPRRSGWFIISANGINDRGQIVGTGVHSGRRKAFLLTPHPPFRFGHR